MKKVSMKKNMVNSLDVNASVVLCMFIQCYLNICSCPRARLKFLFIKPLGFVESAWRSRRGFQHSVFQFQRHSLFKNAEADSSGNSNSIGVPVCHIAPAGAEVHGVHGSFLRLPPAR